MLPHSAPNHKAFRGNIETVCDNLPQHRDKITSPPVGVSIMVPGFALPRHDAFYTSLRMGMKEARSRKTGTVTSCPEGVSYPQP